MRLPVIAVALFCCTAAIAYVSFTHHALGDRRFQRVGQTIGSETRVATGQDVIAPPQTLTYGARPIDMAISPSSQFAYVKDTSGLTVIDLKAFMIVDQTPVKAGPSLCGIALSFDGKTLAYSDAENGVELFQVDGANVSLVATVRLPSPKVGGSPYPCGLAFSNDGERLYVALSRSNAVGLIDVPTRKLTATYPVDTAPAGLALTDDGHLLVTCWAGTAAPGVPTADSSGTQVEIDERGIATGGTLCDLDLQRGEVVRRLPIGLQATDIVVQRTHAFVAASNSDQVFDVDLTNWTATPKLPMSGMLPGSAPSSIAVSGDTLYTAFGGRNTVLMQDLKTRITLETRTPWYPIAVRFAARQVVVACNEGLGMRTRSAKHPGWNSYDFQGSITILGPGTRWDAPAKDPIESRPARPGAAGVPVPLNVGEKSAIQHVVYVLKENRTYDQVLGDIGKGDSDPNLTIYGKSVTPNQHALANQFVLLDNYYCNGVLSADGHAWAMEGNATSYFQRSFGGWTRSYPYGDDPLSVSRSGFIWDDLLDHGKTVRNYGEFDYATPSPNVSYSTILQDFLSGAHTVGYKQNIGVGRLRAISQPGYPGWNLGIPDVVRARLFIKDLDRMERDKSMPAFVIVYLPQDHTSGGNPGAPTPRAQVADNDLAVGRVVEAICKSSFWAHTAIFVNEDDPQNGFDHVDGHRSFCLVVSPYARRNTVVSEFYNQTSVLRTIEHMLGVPAMNRFDASSPLMTDCFQSRPDLTPYTAVPNQIPLDEITPRNSSVALVRVDKPDMVDDDVMNRKLWRAARGSESYPVRFAGPHGLGLAKRGLRLDPHGMKDSD
jgi:YVTN family beta-propeller protein